jgi:hypothetical protein
MLLGSGMVVLSEAVQASYDMIMTSWSHLFCLINMFEKRG